MFDLRFLLVNESHALTGAFTKAVAGILRIGT